MESLLIKREKYTPYVSFDVNTRVFNIEGESYSDDSDTFYQPIIKWLKSYLATNKKSVTLNFKLKYFNTRSSRAFFEILELLEEHVIHKNTKVIVNWYTNAKDVDIIEDGENYKDSFDHLSFNILSQHLV
ncbi:DUF1987 domain-containing protein [uncultured Microscilla sp.]|uniref:DUF1987 domain-containing protein n=1 Tax=uncultured Microscilla sp. TaxID=432653 RepID=UPI0026086971|nr:DUF1987 domain-containing protein [uncultured Microscilla sp.]